MRRAYFFLSFEAVFFVIIRYRQHRKSAESYSFSFGFCWLLPFGNLVEKFRSYFAINVYVENWPSTWKWWVTIWRFWRSKSSNIHLISIMQGDDPPFLSVGTEVSAKYKGAFCEAKVRKVVKSIKCKVSGILNYWGISTDVFKFMLFNRSCSNWA